MKKPELLLPAGSFDRLKTAFLYGADAVYCGTPSMSLRAKSKFTMEEVKQGVELANKLNKKVYLTLNLITHNSDLDKLPMFVDVLREIKPHGVIVADVAVFKYLRENAPELNLHVSTQSNVCSWMSVKFWEEQGAKMCVLAREVSIPEMKEIKEKCPNIKIETFIHGSMCMSYSGRCLLSNFMANRGANQGKCAHSCRWKYKLHLRLKDGTIQEIDINDNNRDLFEFLLEEEKRKGQFLEVQEFEKEANILNSKDLCLLPKLPEYINSEIDCLKVEGRNKTQYYVALVAKTYRKAIDDCYANQQNWTPDKYLDELYTVSNRGFSLAFANGSPTNIANNYYNTESLSNYEFAGYIDKFDDDFIYFVVKNKLCINDELEFITPSYNEKNYKLVLKKIINAKNDQEQQIIGAGGEYPVIKIELSTLDIKKDDFIRYFPVLTVARKIKTLNAEAEKRIKMDKESFIYEIKNG